MPMTKDSSAVTSESGDLDASSGVENELSVFAEKLVAKHLGKVERTPHQAKILTRNLARSLDAVTQIVTELKFEELIKMDSQPSAAMAVLTAFRQPSAGRTFQDPLAPARARAVEGVKEILAAEGGTLQVEEAATQLGITPAELEQRRAAGKVLGVELEPEGYGYPSWQFIGPHMLLGIEEIMPLLADDPPLAQMRFFLTSNPRLQGKSPLQMLRHGAVDKVRKAALVFGEQGAA
ncbi:hypothetical protein [Chondromyces apiculatus]|uniref:Antitoxin Xre/MbcA/ParS-like toxin-binding domain-containing protein n=1 Tax=Chondromyces apiculatus DSM 436 TaxID=1192034 RepID=A0A017SXP3_9BACT|nr:hypothetical protein [Chondromyces apiculatus]EYF01764.1 Hypothetical protein CAP_7830 [Chondromyces apiculatus DSM 436]